MWIRQAVVGDDLDRHHINSCGTVQPNWKDMPRDFGPKQLKLKRGNVRVRTRGGSTTLVWKGRREDYMLPNMDPPPAEGNFCDENNCPVKPHIMEQYNRHMDYVDNSDRMATSYSMSRRTLKGTTKLFFHLLDLMLAIHVHSMHYAIHSCNSKSVTIALHEVRMKVYGVLFNGLFTLNWMMHCMNRAKSSE